MYISKSCLTTNRDKGFTLIKLLIVIGILAVLITVVVIVASRSNTGGSNTGGGGGTPAWTCGDTLTDTRDSKTYATVQIGTQCWMKQGMNIGTRIDGGGEQGTDCNSASAIQKYCYNNTDAICNSSNNPNYPDGGLYQWNQAMCGLTTPGAQGICPTGWHLPTDAQQHTLDSYLATGACDPARTDWGCDPAGTKLKPNGTSGFEGNLAGYRYTDGSFDDRGTDGYFWSSSQYDASRAWDRLLSSFNATVYRGDYYGALGFSVRCLKD